MRRYEHYKDSGLDWLGEIPAHWDIRRLKFSVSLSTQKLLAKPEQLPYIGLENIESQTGQLLMDVQPEDVESTVNIFQRGDVLFNKLRPYLAKVVCADFSGVCTTELLVFHPINSILKARYLFYRLLSDDFIGLVNSFTYGTKMPRANREQITNISLPIPPRAEQDAIVAFLDRKLAEIDRFIANKQRMIALLKEQKAAIINRAVTRGIEPGVPLKPSGIEWLGEIPAHWEALRVKFLLTLMEQGWSPQCEARWRKENEWGVLKVGCVNGYTFNELEHKALPDNLLPRTEYEIKCGDVLISRANTRELVGSTALVETAMPKLLLCDKLYRIHLKESVIPLFFIHMLRSQASRFQIELGASGASDSMQNIGQDVIKNLWIALPSTQEQAKILAYIAQQIADIDNTIHRTEREIELIKEYRTTLISDAVTGKIDVRAACRVEREKDVPAIPYR